MVDLAEGTGVIGMQRCDAETELQSEACHLLPSPHILSSLSAFSSDISVLYLETQVTRTGIPNRLPSYLSF